MRIVHIVWGLGTGGVETMLVDLVNVQVETEDVSIAIVNEIEEPALLQKTDRRCEVYRAHRKTGSRSLLPWIRLNGFLLRKNPDIIHFHLDGMRKMVLHPRCSPFTIYILRAKSTRTMHAFLPSPMESGTIQDSKGMMPLPYGTG